MNENKVNSYKDLVVWQKSKDFVRMTYEATKNFPNEEQFGLTSQLRRAAVSIPSNIAEGFYRNSKKEQMQFSSVAFGSGAEVETQLTISKELGYLDEKEYNALNNTLDEIMKMLNKLTSNFREQS